MAAVYAMHMVDERPLTGCSLPEVKRSAASHAGDEYAGGGRLRRC